MTSLYCFATSDNLMSILNIKKEIIFLSYDLNNNNSRDLYILITNDLIHYIKNSQSLQPNLFPKK